MPRATQRNGDTDGSNKPPRQVKKGFKQHRQAEFQGWVNVNIPEANRAAFTEFETSASCLDAFDIIGQHNIRLSVIQEYGEEGFVATAFHMDETLPCGGLMVSQRSASSFRALAKLAYCIVELMPDDWSELLDNGKGNW